MTTHRPAFYASTGSRGADVVAILHPPYTLWHLSYVAIGAGLAPTLDGLRLAGTLVAFVAGLGVGAHALDELNGRPLRTRLPDRTLWLLAGGSLGVVIPVAVMGASLISPWVLAWTLAGIALAVTYSLELWGPIHTRWGFAVAWGGFPVLVGYWAQVESLSLAALMAAATAAVLSAVQHALSNEAKRVRRRRLKSTVPDTDRERLLATWETPLRYLSAAMPLLALTLLATHL